MNLQHQVNNTAGVNGSARERNKNQSMIIHKILGWPQATKNNHDQQILTKKQHGRSPTAATTAISKNNKDRQRRQQPTVLHTPQIPLSSPQEKPSTYTGRLKQPNNLLNVLTANVQSLSPKIDELIALIQSENFDVIVINETWLDTQNKHLLAEVATHGNIHGFSCGQTNSNRKGSWINHVCQKHIEPNRREVISHLYKSNYTS